MVGGFLGVVIALERAVAQAERWAFLAPGLAGLGSLALLIGLPTQLGAALLVACSAVLMIIFGLIHRVRPERSTILLLVSAAVWLVGNALWLADRQSQRWCRGGLAFWCSLSWANGWSLRRCRSLGANEHSW
ncbi:MAG: hypothetical protein JO020_03190 [Chloroflexi bacterium]|nr:hypothetical protein [Chloroflexota bacterium]MBV9893154.1 hypothetical protein [Chloroflexota bacterium]